MNTSPAKLLTLFMLSVLFFNSMLWAQQANEARDIEPSDSQPKMRPIDRDWQYFKTVPCERIDKEIFHSRSEELLLAQRKSQCVNRYKAFLPKPLS